ncbi:class I SAM-dependent methyltransferase [Shewanella youngdeokensis]|uniref:Methyltransferase domain-containing protein n=1 Tax=Shewanella youngdeokensis TaxID=2999068 RepID=A0ABZ0K273_9GAMM|nr:methyltransferase domain-containing protein [Shewanella sp. DAU334]
MESLVNWRLVRERMYARTEGAKAANWDKFADMYDNMAKLETRFTQKQVDSMPIEPSDTVVDIGCGPGRLSIPVARRAGEVTCVDAFANMLDRCITNASVQGIDNINPLLLDWNADDAVERIGVHDVAIASRSVGFSDLVKLNQVASKYAIIMNFANAPSLREIQLDFLEGITEQPNRKYTPSSRALSYNVTFNMLYDMGAEPNILILDDGFEATFDTKQAAYDGLRFVGDIPAESEARFRQNVDKYLTETDDKRWRLFRPTRSYIMWWKTSDVNA